MVVYRVPGFKFANNSATGRRTRSLNLFELVIILETKHRFADEHYDDLMGLPAAN